MGKGSNGTNHDKADPVGEELADDVLIRGTLHRVMVLFHRPVGWPIWQIGLACLLGAALEGAIWRVSSGSWDVAWRVALFMLLFIALDIAILRWLPERGLSFGPWKGQIFALALPRLLIGAALALTALLVSDTWSSIILVVFQIIGTLALVWGAVIEPFRLQMTNLVIFSDRMSPDKPGIRLLHISDLHVERLTRREHRLIELAEQASPDLIVITGDYLNLSYNRDLEAKAHVRRLLGKLSAPDGVYAVLGSPPVDLRDQVLPIFEGLEVKLMADTYHVVDLGQERKLLLLGLDCSHDIPSDASRLEKLAAQAPNSIPSVLLYHAPDLMPQAAGHQIDLYLCGHTHGGQVRLPFIGALLTSSQYGKRYEMGHYHLDRTHLYVSRGVGLEGLSAPRVRFLAPPEITLVTIRGSKRSSR